jgi:hypothetical protein
VSTQFSHYLRRRLAYRKMKDEIADLQRSLMIEQGWSFYDPGTAGWEASVERLKLVGHSEVYLRKYHATTTLIFDPVERRVYTTFHAAFAVCERRLQKAHACDAIATADGGEIS